jgi:hypothetical protein
MRRHKCSNPNSVGVVTAKSTINKIYDKQMEN